MRRLKKHRESDYCDKSGYGMHRSTFTKVIETGKGFKNFILSVSHRVFACPKTKSDKISGENHFFQISTPESFLHFSLPHGITSIFGVKICAR